MDNKALAEFQGSHTYAYMYIYVYRETWELTKHVKEPGKLTHALGYQTPSIKVAARYFKNAR